MQLTKEPSKSKRTIAQVPLSPQSTRRGEIPAPLDQLTDNSQARITTRNTTTVVWLLRSLLGLTFTVTRHKLPINFNKTYNLN